MQYSRATRTRTMDCCASSCRKLNEASTYIFVLASDENHVACGTTVVRLDERGRVDRGAGFVVPAFGGCGHNSGINLVADLLAGCGHIRSARGASKEQYEEHHVLKGRV